MVRRRKTILREQQAIIDNINNELKKLVKLRLEEWQTTDKEKQYIEEDEEVLVCGRPKKYETHRIGRVHWVDDIKDDDTGKIININRSMIVKQDGKWMMENTITFKFKVNEDE